MILMKLELNWAYCKINDMTGFKDSKHTLLTTLSMSLDLPVAASLILGGIMSCECYLTSYNLFLLSKVE